MRGEERRGEIIKLEERGEIISRDRPIYRFTNIFPIFIIGYRFKKKTITDIFFFLYIYIYIYIFFFFCHTQLYRV